MQRANITIADEKEGASSSASGYSLQPTAYSLLLRHWPEYLIEGWALGMFMVSAGVFATALDYPRSPLHHAIADGNVRRALGGVAMGLTAIALIHSPWGKRSGAHMNPAITLAFLRLKHVARWDAAFYILAQFIGGTLGVLLVRAVLGDAFVQPPVAHAATMPLHGVTIAFAAEFGISFLMMTMVLRASNSERYMRYTGLFAGLLVALFITFEAPYSGMSMNPARSFASAFPAGMWSGLWIYFVAPVLAMQAAVAMHLKLRGAASVKCSKLMHTPDQRCIHCGYQP
ncbi:MAG TPA: aquaporin [Steroidobacteraceae bacterium]|jgi:aquaporin Z